MFHPQSTISSSYKSRLPSPAHMIHTKVKHDTYVHICMCTKRIQSSGEYVTMNVFYKN